MFGYTPLHMACSWPQPEVVQKLIELGANVEARNHELKTPLSLASDEGNTKVNDVTGGTVTALHRSDGTNWTH